MLFYLILCISSSYFEKWVLTAEVSYKPSIFSSIPLSFKYLQASYHLCLILPRDYQHYHRVNSLSLPLSLLPSSLPPLSVFYSCFKPLLLSFAFLLSLIQLIQHPPWASVGSSLELSLKANYLSSHTETDLSLIYYLVSPYLCFFWNKNNNNIHRWEKLRKQYYFFTSILSLFSTHSNLNLCCESLCPVKHVRHSLSLGFMRPWVILLILFQILLWDWLLCNIECMLKNGGEYLNKT